MGGNNLACYFDSMGIYIVWIPCGCHTGIAISFWNFLIISYYYCIFSWNPEFEPLYFFLNYAFILFVNFFRQGALIQEFAR